MQKFTINLEKYEDDEPKALNKTSSVVIILETILKNENCYPAVNGDRYVININNIPEELLGRTSKEELLIDPTNLQCRLVAFIGKSLRKPNKKSPISICAKEIASKNKKILMFRWNYDQDDLERDYAELAKVVKGGSLSDAIK